MNYLTIFLVILSIINRWKFRQIANEHRCAWCDVSGQLVSNYSPIVI